MSLSNTIASSTSLAKQPRHWSLRTRLSVRRQTVQIVGCQLLLAAVLLGVWQWATGSAALNSFLFGSPSAIWGRLVAMVRDGSVWSDTYVTGAETLAGFALGNIVGTAVGLSLWYSRFISRVLQPFVLALGSIPMISIAPIVIIWFGTGFASKVAMATLAVVVVSLIISYKGAMGVDPDQINLMRSLGAAKSQIFRYLVVHSSLTDIFAGLKMTVGFALVGAIVGEFMSSTDGLGHAIFKAGSLYIISKVFAELAVTIILSLILTAVVVKIERILLPWRHDLK
jgi:NitT/TauT family transport system permease protein